ncbi:DUF2198 family protein [Metabacillus arenae]|uniref:CsbA family protein n=1 Tax=Metabacillus arenae TaxID=2771434 RepID=A0A926NP93_9BACI|nr:DUF2198 family protein [Metabacillus arenae]MBD1381426.1 CsbA family protein [Metabacillus arenae]
MVTKAILALILPFVLVLLFTRVTYNHYVGALLTAALLLASYFKGYSDYYMIAGLDAVSLVAGFMFARNLKEKHNKN